MKGDESNDDELAEARERKKKTTVELFELVQNLQRDLITANVGQGQSFVTGLINDDEDAGYVSEYTESEEEELTQDEEGEGEGIKKRREARALKVSDGFDWSTLQWRVGQRFPNRDCFREAVARFAIFQGRNVSIVSSNKKRLQRLEVRCLPECNFRLFAS